MYFPNLFPNVLSKCTEMLKKCFLTFQYIDTWKHSLWTLIRILHPDMTTQIQNTPDAVRLPENSSNIFLDLPSQKDSKRNRPKKLLFIKCWDTIFWYGICSNYCCFYLTRNNLTWIKEKSKFQEWGSHFWEWGMSHVTKNLITRTNKKLPLLKVKNEVMQAIQWKYINEWTQSKFEVKWSTK